MAPDAREGLSSMAVLFDASVLIDLFNHRLVGERRARLDHLIASLQKQRTTVLVPTPAYAEFLVRAGKAREAYLLAFDRQALFRVEPFDQRAALECALLLEEAWSKGQQAKISHTKFKFDWQIVAIAASRNATAIYSDDADIAKAAARVSIPVHPTALLPMPASAAQSGLPFDTTDEPSDPPLQN
jgi:predicted nucleic acid-binding protein